MVLPWESETAFKLLLVTGLSSRWVYLISLAACWVMWKDEVRLSEPKSSSTAWRTWVMSWLGARCAFLSLKFDWISPSFCRFIKWARRSELASAVPEVDPAASAVRGVDPAASAVRGVDPAASAVPGAAASAVPEVDPAASSGPSQWTIWS
jgi:hypothetical protein